MTNPIAVLLIIGSAVVGPIEAQRVDRQDVDRTVARDQCYKTHGGSPAVFAPDGQRYDVATYCDTIAGTRLESLAELCERAMREIGGVEWPGDASGNVYVLARSQGTLIHCIPVPAGYKR